MESRTQLHGVYMAAKSSEEMTLLQASRLLHLGECHTLRPLDHPMNDAVTLHHALRDITPPLSAGGFGRNTQAVHGTPITPGHLLSQMDGASFCVSFFRPDQLDDVIPYLGPLSILMLDNGAFSAWRQGVTLDAAHWEAYWRWALPVLDAIPQAVAVIPDVIGGTVEENRYLYSTGLPDTLYGREMQICPVWHLDEPFTVLLDLMETGYGRIAFGSSGHYRSVGTGLWRNRVADAFEFIDKLVGDGLNGFFRPRIHSMRGLGQMKFGEFPFDSADSTNLAVNHCRLKGTENESRRVQILRERIEAGSFPTPPSRMWPAGSYENPPCETKVAALRPA